LMFFAFFCHLLKGGHNDAPSNKSLGIARLSNFS
jgi:hypothetical protein